MRRQRCRFPDAAIALAAIVIASIPSRAWAQACCAGGSAVTPGRLEPHEDALVGTQIKAASIIGSYDPRGHFIGSPGGDTEYDFEQDVFGALRLLRRGQAALLVPFVQTFRSTPQDGSHLGGGIGDINLSARYDFVLAGESRYVPGIALLAGVTFPTGTPVESATQPLAVDSTGVGAFQGNVGLGLEQTFGPWLVNATGIVAERAPRGGEMLGTQVTLLAAGAYTFTNDAALALSASYAFEGDARDSSGADVPSSYKRVTVISLSGLYPITDKWRVLGGLYLNPPVTQLGSNQPASAGLALTVIRSWI
jgi:hypothetical protein